MAVGASLCPFCGVRSAGRAALLVAGLVAVTGCDDKTQTTPPEPKTERGDEPVAIYGAPAPEDLDDLDTPDEAPTDDTQSDEPAPKPDPDPGGKLELPDEARPPPRPIYAAPAPKP